MKKFSILTKTLMVVLSFICIFALTGCDDKEYTKQEEQVQAVVVTCDDGVFYLNQTYLAIANMYLAQKNTGMWSYYMTQASAQGETRFTLTVSVDGKEVELVRKEKYEAGQSISVTKVTTYDGNKIVETEYK